MGDGDDVIYGGAGADILNGGAGDDYIDAGDGDDKVFGSAGNDTLVHSGSGTQLFDGGSGIDTYVIDINHRLRDNFVAEVNLRTNFSGDQANPDYELNDTIFNIENITILADVDAHLVGETMQCNHWWHGRRYIGEAMAMMGLKVVEDDSFSGGRGNDTIDLSNEWAFINYDYVPHPDDLYEGET